MPKVIHPIKSNMLGRVLVKPYVNSALHSDVLFLDSHEQAQDSNVGFIVSVGSTVKVDVKVGDEVIFQKFKPRMFEIDGEMHLFVTEDLLHAKIVRE